MYPLESELPVIKYRPIDTASTFRVTYCTVCTSHEVTRKMMEVLERVILFHAWLQTGETEQPCGQVSVLWKADSSTRVRGQRI